MNELDFTKIATPVPQYVNHTYRNVNHLHIDYLNQLDEHYRTINGACDDSIWPFDDMTSGIFRSMKFTIEPSSPTPSKNSDEDLISVWTYPPNIISYVSNSFSFDSSGLDLAFNELNLVFDFEQMERSKNNSDFGVKIIIPSDVLATIDVNGRRLYNPELFNIADIAYAIFHEPVVEVDVKPGFTNITSIDVNADGVLIRADLTTNLGYFGGTDVNFWGNSTGIFKTGEGIAQTEDSAILYGGGWQFYYPTSFSTWDAGASLYINGSIGNLFVQVKPDDENPAIVVINGDIKYGATYFDGNATIIAKNCISRINSYTLYSICKEVDNINETIFAPNNIYFNTENDPMTMNSNFSICGPSTNYLKHKKETKSISIAVPVVVALAIITVIIFTFVCKKRRRTKHK